MNLNNIKRVAITGAAGTIGSLIVHYFLNKTNAIICAIDNSEDGLFNLKEEIATIKNKGSRLRFILADIKDSDRIKRSLNGSQLLIHCAAYKHVELGEINPFDCFETNVTGTANIIKAALENKISKILFTSSDKAINPTNVMGATKLIGERLIISSNNLIGSDDIKFSIVRFGNVLGSRGSVFPIFKKFFFEGKPYPITDESMTRFFISPNEAVDLCIKALQQMKGADIFLYPMRSASVLSLAKAISNKDSINYKKIGSKIGEKLYEELVTNQEINFCYQDKKLIKIIPNINNISNLKIKNSLIKDSKLLKKINVNPNSNDDLINWKELRKYLIKESLIND